MYESHWLREKEQRACQSGHMVRSNRTAHGSSPANALADKQGRLHLRELDQALKCVHDVQQTRFACLLVPYEPTLLACILIGDEDRWVAQDALRLNAMDHALAVAALLLASSSRSPTWAGGMPHFARRGAVGVSRDPGPFCLKGYRLRTPKKRSKTDPVRPPRCESPPPLPGGSRGIEGWVRWGSRGVHSGPQGPGVQGPDSNVHYAPPTNAQLSWISSNDIHLFRCHATWTLDPGNITLVTLPGPGPALDLDPGPWTLVTLPW